MYCPNCGFNNKVNVGICINCKLPLYDVQPEEVSILDSDIEQKMEFVEDNIYSYNEEFVIVADIKGFKINYGYSNTINEAIQRRDKLIDDGWPIPKGLLDVEEISQNIIKKDNQFIVYNEINDKTVVFGKYDSLKDANAAKFKLIKNNWSKSIIEQKPILKRKITDNIYKQGNKYLVQKEIDGKLHIFGRFKSKIDAFAIEKVLNKVKWNVSRVNKINKKPNKNIFKINNIFYIVFESNSKLYILGKYPSLELAMEKKEGLIAEKIRMDTVGNIRDKHIWRVRDGFEVRNKVDGFIKTFGIYNSREEARRARDEFVNNNWQENFSEDSLFKYDDSFMLDSSLNEVLFSLSPMQKVVFDIIDSLNERKFTIDDLKSTKSRLRLISKNNIDSKLNTTLNDLINLKLIKQVNDFTFEKLWDV